MVEHRKSRRKQAAYGIPVTNAISGEAIGHVGNLSIDGMLLIANRELRENALFQFSFELPSTTGTTARRVEIGVHEQWGEPSRIPGQYWAGFRIIDIAPEDREVLAAWVNRADHH